MEDDCSAKTFLRKDRLLIKSEFDAVFAGGRKVVRPSVVVFALTRGESADRSRIGLVTSRRVGKATVRNRRRRQVRELFRLNRGLLTQPMDLVVVFRQRLEVVKFSDLQRDLLGAFEKLAKRD